MVVCGDGGIKGWSGLLCSRKLALNFADKLRKSVKRLTMLQGKKNTWRKRKR